MLYVTNSTKNSPPDRACVADTHPSVTDMMMSESLVQWIAVVEWFGLSFSLSLSLAVWNKKKITVSGTSLKHLIRRQCLLYIIANCKQSITQFSTLRQRVFICNQGERRYISHGYCVVRGVDVGVGVASTHSFVRSFVHSSRKPDHSRDYVRDNKYRH